MEAASLSLLLSLSPRSLFPSLPPLHSPTRWKNRKYQVALHLRNISPKVRKNFGKRIKCCSDGKGNSIEDEGGRRICYDFLPDIDNRVFRKIAKEMSNCCDSLLRVTETFNTSVVAPFLIGMVLLLDFMKSAQSPYWRQQIVGLKFYEIIMGSYSFLFIASMATSTLLGFLCIPFLRKLKAYQIIRKEGPAAHFSKSGTPTMGGLFFIPAAIAICGYFTNYVSVQLDGLICATLLFGGIGLLDDVLSLVRKHNYGLPAWCKLLLQVMAGVWFFWWNKSADLPTTVEVKTMLLLPHPLKHWNLGPWYLPLSAFCFAAMSNGVNLTDGLDGLAAGSAAAAFSGMAVASLNLYPVVTIFGVSMAGACVGFLVHNHHKATVFMGDTGSLALGGALAAMASTTGLFLPLLICSGVFFIETVSVILQISYKKYTKKRTGVTKKLFRMAPIHHHFELGGMKESTIVAVAHIISCVLAIFGAVAGLVISRC